MTVAHPALRYHGGKFRLAPWILQFFPPHGCYVEPFGGAAGVLLQKERSYAEVYNDLDGEIVNLFKVLRDPSSRAALVEACKLTPYAREEFELAYEPASDPIECARRTCVRAAMGFGSADATKGVTGFRTDTRRKYGTAQHLWAEYPETLGAIGERFRGVLVENRDAVEVMRAHDGPDVLHFVDPPYMHEARNPRNGNCYRHELDDNGHLRVLNALHALEGMVVVCGYRTPLYDEALREWTRYETAARISGGRGTSMRTEVVWLNQACTAALEGRRGGLFGCQAA